MTFRCYLVQVKSVSLWIDALAFAYVKKKNSEGESGRQNELAGVIGGIL